MSERDELERDESLRIAERDRAHRANVILSDDLVKDALKALRDDAWSAFTSAKANDASALQLARLKFDVAEEFVNKLATHIRTGEMAAQQLNWIQARLARLRRAA